MTKLRAAASFKDAIVRIVAQCPGGWAEVAAEVGKSERTVRHWSDPDAATLPTIDDCLALDALALRRGSG